MSMLWGMPASLFSNSIWNAASAGTESSPTSNAMFSALSLTTAPPDAAGDPDGSAEPDGGAEPDGVSEPEACGEPDAAGDPLPPGLALACVNSSCQQAG